MTEHLFLTPGEGEPLAVLGSAMTVLAGGYTFRARTNKIELMRANNPDKPILVDQNTLLLPGDIIRIKERFF